MFEGSKDVVNSSAVHGGYAVSRSFHTCSEISFGFRGKRLRRFSKLSHRRGFSEDPRANGRRVARFGYASDDSSLRL
eukprot:1227120-Pyramimonas_sp.AAC.1